MLRLTIGFKWGAATGAAGGLLVGLLVGVFAALTTTLRFDLLNTIANGFGLLAIILPLFFHLNFALNPDTAVDRPFAKTQAYWISILAWLTAIVTAVIFFMMPITMTPIIFNKGVTFETVNGWYQEVFNAILGFRFVGMAALALIGFLLVAYSQHQPAR